MNLAAWLTHPWATLWTETLLHFLWQGALLTVVAGGAQLLKKPTTRYAWLVAVFVAMTACPAATLLWLSQSGESVSSEPAQPSSSPIEHGATIWSLAPAALDERFNPSTLDEPFADRFGFLSQAFSASSASSWREWAQPAVLGTWGVGVAVFLLRIILGTWGLSRLMRAAKSAPENWATVGRNLCVRFHLRRTIPIRSSTDIREPLALWWWRPVILLPAAWLTELPPGVLESVLAHELAHLRRFDLWVNFYQRLGEMLLFYHPGLWWVSRRIRLERELCCDAAAVTLTGEPVGYAQALEYVALKRLELVRPILAQGMGGTDMTLLNRIQRVLGLEAPQRATGWLLGLASAAVLLAVGLLSALSSRAVVGDERTDRPVGTLVAQNDEDENEAPLPPRRDDKPRGPAGDRPPPRDGGPPPGRRGDGPPRENPGEDGADRGPGRNFGGLGRRGGPPPGGDIMQDLMQELRALRQEVAELRQEVRALRGDRGPGGPDDPQGPPRGRGGPGGREGGPPPRNGDFGSRRPGGPDDLAGPQDRGDGSGDFIPERRPSERLPGRGTRKGARPPAEGSARPKRPPSDDPSEGAAVEVPEDDGF